MPRHTSRERSVKVFHGDSHFAHFARHTFLFRESLKINEEILMILKGSDRLIREVQNCFLPFPERANGPMREIPSLNYRGKCCDKNRAIPSISF
jgi:hypothetical protein